MKPLNIVHLFPELLNLYGDGGNVMTLRRRCEWRNIPVQVTEVGMGDSIDFSSADIVFIGGGADREQLIVKDAMMSRKADLLPTLPMPACFWPYAEDINSWATITPWMTWWWTAWESSTWRLCEARAA